MNTTVLFNEVYNDLVGFSYPSLIDIAKNDYGMENPGDEFFTVESLATKCAILEVNNYVH